MNSVNGDYFNGTESKRWRGTLTSQDEVVSLSTGEAIYHYAFDDLMISSRLDLVPRSIRFPDGSQLMTTDNDAVDALMKQHGQAFQGTIAHKLESYIPLVIGSWIGVVALALWFYIFAIPHLVGEAVKIVPEAWEYDLGEEVLSNLLDQKVLQPPEFTAEQQTEADRVIAGLYAITPEELTVTIGVYDSAYFGANAIALPGGHIVITHELFNLAETNDELIAVYLHELGHVQHRHALRAALQRSVVALMIMLTTGDVSAATDLAVTLPTMLLTLSYSREFELVADDFALGAMQQHDISTEHFATIMRRLAEQQPASAFFGSEYLSTHPAPTTRIERIEDQ